MKRFLIFSILAIMSIAMYAQTKTFIMKEEQTYLSVQNNFTVTYTTESWFLIRAAKDFPMTQYFQCKLDTNTGTHHTTVTVTLYGRMSSADSWTQISTPSVWTVGIGTSTVLTIENTTPAMWRQYKVGYVGAGAAGSTSNIDYQTLKLTYAGVTSGGKYVIDGVRNDDTQGYEYWLDVQGDITSTGDVSHGAKTFAINSSITRPSGVNTVNTDMEDALIKGTITNRATGNTTNYIMRGINVAAVNRDANATQDDVNWLEGAYITAKNQTANTGTAEMRGIYCRVDLDPSTTATTETGALKAELDLDANAPAVSYGVQAYYQSAGSYTKPVAGLWINAGASDYWQYGLKIEAGKVTTDISLQNGETISNATDGTVAVSGVLSANQRFATVVTNTDATETLTAAQSGALVVATNASGATTITIPDASAATIGVIYYIMQTADQNLIVTATTANNNSIVCDGVATSDNVTISTASHKIGAGMIVIGISATQWYVGGLNPESLLTPEAAD